METLSIKQVANILNVSYWTVFNNRHRWGFYQMDGSRLWRVDKSNLDLLKKRSNNDRGLALSVGEEKLCRSEKEVTSITLTSTPLVEKELDALLKQL
ncbi:DNA-binding protein [Mannheimia haemolytica]|nr:DNA-binding protein [Mannheimia varigena]TRC17854.1 DNA-binding protein [Mannheimia haemolytica]TRC68913.1 DNA-binding protein [Mannheimia haemolytica]